MMNFQAHSVTRVEAKEPHAMLHGLLNAPEVFLLALSASLPLLSTSLKFRVFILHQRPLHYLCPPMSELRLTVSASSFAFSRKTYAVQADLKFPKNAKHTSLKFSGLFFSKDRISLCKPGWPRTQRASIKVSHALCKRWSFPECAIPLGLFLMATASVIISELF